MNRIDEYIKDGKAKVSKDHENERLGDKINKKFYSDIMGKFKEFETLLQSKDKENQDLQNELGMSAICFYTDKSIR